MGNRLVQKTFKVEFEITVNMDEVDGQHLSDEQPTSQLSHLKHLQEALLEDDTALSELATAYALGKLHDYIDYLTTQDTLEPLKKITDHLAPADRKFFQKYQCDFFDITRPLRRSSLSARLNSSTISEQGTRTKKGPTWNPVWSDLIPTSEFGKLLEKMSISLLSTRHQSCKENSHNLLARHLSRQRDGIHFEGHCTCGTVLEGVGADEDQAVDALWDNFRQHNEKYQPQERI